MVLELPQRQYLDDAEFSKVIGMTLEQESEVDSKPRDEAIPHSIIVNSTSNFINKNNFDLFIGTNEKKCAVDNDYKMPPILPCPKYLEDGGEDEVPKVPDRGYTEDDIRDLTSHSGRAGDSTVSGKQSNPFSNTAITGVQTKECNIRPQRCGRRGVSDTETVYISPETGMGQILRKFNKKPNPGVSSEEDSQTNDYTPLDFSTLETKPVSGLAETYMCLSKPVPGKTQENATTQEVPKYMSLTGTHDSIAGVKSPYMSVKSAPNVGNINFSGGGTKKSSDDDGGYMPLTTHTMTRKTAELANTTTGLKNAADKAQVAVALTKSEDSNSDYMSLQIKR